MEVGQFPHSVRNQFQFHFHWQYLYLSVESAAKTVSIVIKHSLFLALEGTKYFRKIEPNF